MRKIIMVLVTLFSLTSFVLAQKPQCPAEPWNLPLIYCNDYTQGPPTTTAQGIKDLRPGENWNCLDGPYGGLQVKIITDSLFGDIPIASEPSELGPPNYPRDPRRQADCDLLRAPGAHRMFSLQPGFKYQVRTLHKIVNLDYFVKAHSDLLVRRGFTNSVASANVDINNPDVPNFTGLRAELDDQYGIGAACPFGADTNGCLINIDGTQCCRTTCTMLSTCIGNNWYWLVYTLQLTPTSFPLDRIDMTGGIWLWGKESLPPAIFTSVCVTRSLVQGCINNAAFLDTFTATSVAALRDYPINCVLVGNQCLPPLMANNLVTYTDIRELSPDPVPPRGPMSRPLQLRIR